MSIKLSYADHWFMFIGAGLIIMGIYELIDNDGYNKSVGFWLLGGFVLLGATYWDAFLQKDNEEK